MTEELGVRILAELAAIRAQQADIQARLPAAAPELNRSLARREAAAYLGQHPKTLADLTAAGVVPAYKVGSRWKYRLADLDRYREQLAQGSKPRADRERAIDWAQ